MHVTHPLLQPVITDALSHPKATQFFHGTPNLVKELLIRPAMFSPVASSSRLGRQKRSGMIMRRDYLYK